MDKLKIDNIHHNVPRSRGGTDNQINLSDVSVERHVQYHDITQNRTPCYLARLVAILSIGLNGNTIPSKDLKNILKGTVRRNLAQLYHPMAIKNITDDNAFQVLIQSFEWSVKYLLEERRALEEAIYIVSLPNGNPPMPTFLEKIFNFFKADTPESTIRSLFTEKNGKNLNWVKPVKKDVRRRVLYMVKKNKQVSLGFRERQLVDGVLRSQLMTVNKHINKSEQEAKRHKVLAMDRFNHNGQTLYIP